MERNLFYVDFCARSTVPGSACPDGHGSAAHATSDTSGHTPFSPYDHCVLCPRACGANRSLGQRGYCGMTSELRIARVGLHMWEEPCLSGSTGSGTIFFTGCPLGCLFCQNHDISRRTVAGRSTSPSDPTSGATASSSIETESPSSGAASLESADVASPYPLPGRIYSVDRLADAMLDLQAQGAHNINFVTGTHYVPHIIEGVRLARARGLSVPTLYNCGGYESADTIRRLQGTIDIYLPDMKFYSPDISRRYAHAADYFDRAREALAEMVRQCPEQEYDENGMMKRGVIVRHLMLPGALFDTKHILDYLTENYGNRITISLMNQYTPMPGAPEELARPLPQKHYDSMVNYLLLLGQTNAFTQEGGTVSSSFIPDFE